MILIEDDEDDGYDDQLTEEQWRSLFGESDDEDEFEGFQCAGVRAKKTTAPLGATKSEKKSMINDKNVSVYFSLSTSTQTTW